MTDAWNAGLRMWRPHERRPVANLHHRQGARDIAVRASLLVRGVGWIMRHNWRVAEKHLQGHNTGVRVCRDDWRPAA